MRYTKRPKPPSSLPFILGLILLMAITIGGYLAAKQWSAPDIAVTEPAPTEQVQTTEATSAAPQAAEPEQPNAPPAPAALSAQIAALGTGFGGDVGIAVRSIENDWVAGYRAADKFPQQSVSKLWVATTIMDKVDAGEIALDEPIMLSAKDLSIFHQPIRKKILASGSFRTTIAQLLWYAMTQSDNTANDVLLRRAGGQAGVEAFFTRKELNDISMSAGEKELQMAVSGMQWSDSYSYGRNFWAARKLVPFDRRQRAMGAYLADPIDGATSDAVASGLARLASGKLLSPESSAYLLDLMAQSKTGPKRLKGGLSEGWSMAHKTGTGQVLKQLATGYNDVGILTSPSGKQYALVVMIGATNRPVPERQDLMQAVTRGVIACDAAGQGC